MYDSFFDELEKIAVEEAKKPNWGRRAAIGGAVLGTALAGGYALKRGFRRAAHNAAVKDAARKRAQMIVDKLGKLGI